MNWLFSVLYVFFWSLTVLSYSLYIAPAKYIYFVILLEPYLYIKNDLFYIQKTTIIMQAHIQRLLFLKTFIFISNIIIIIPNHLIFFFLND